MIGLASPRRRLTGRALDHEVERLLTEYDLELSQDSAGAPEGVAGVDLRRSSTGAVEPLEIAAALEAVGVRPPALRARFGREDVFELADDIFERVPLSPVMCERPLPPKGGTVRDLWRGLAFAVPGIAFTDVLRAAEVHVAGWALPFALTLGWALSQVMATLGHTLLNRRDAVGLARVLTVAMGLGVSAVLGVSTAGALSTGASIGTVVVGTLFVAFMLASGVLLLFEEERILGWSLVPVSAAYLIALTKAGGHSTGPIVLVLGGATVAIVVLGALRHGTWRIWGPARLERADAGDALRHLVHGACCGAAVSFVLVRALAMGPSGGVRELVTWPLLVTLGVMEWQLRSLRSALHRLRNTLGSVERYEASGWRTFARSLGAYTGSVLAASLVVGGVLVWDASRAGSGWDALGGLALEPLVAQALIGVVLFVDLVAVTFGGVRRTLRAWVVVLVPLAGAWQLIAAHRAAPATDPTVWFAVGALGLVGVALFVVARRAVRSPFI